MDMQKLRDMGEPELRAELLALRKTRMNLRMQARAGQLPRNHLLRAARRDIAQVQTALRARRAGGAP